MFLPHPRVKVSIAGSLRDREVACSASDRQGSNFESCVWRTVSSQSSHHPQEVLLAQFSLYVHKGGLKPDSFHFLPYNGIRKSPENAVCFLEYQDNKNIKTLLDQHAYNIIIFCEIWMWLFLYITCVDQVYYSTPSHHICWLLLPQFPPQGEYTYHPLRYERVYLPLCKVADIPSHI